MNKKWYCIGEDPKSTQELCGTPEENHINKRHCIKAESPQNAYQKWMKHQITLANKREARSMIADMCGTSFSAACADMGMNKF